MAVTNEQITSWLAANPTASDATIAAAMSQYGVSPAQMAAATGIAPEVVQSRYEAALPAPAPAPVATPAPAPAPEPAAAPLYTTLTSSSTPQQIAAAYQQAISGAGGDTAANQKIATDYLTNLGISTPTIQSAYQDFLSTIGSAAPTTTPATTGPLLTYHTGKEYAGNDVLALAQQLAAATSSGALKGGVYGEQGASIGFDFDQAKKLLGENTNAASQVFLDAATNLLDKGVTNLNQLKPGDIMGQATVRPEVDEFGRQTGRYMAYWGGDYEGNNQQSRVLTPEEAAKVVAKEVRSGDESYTAYEPVELAVGKGIYDDKGRLVSDTNQLQIGETYTGPGGTQYHLTFDPQTGMPAFSTTGISTGNLGDVAGVLSVLQFVPGLQVPVALANAALAAYTKNPLAAVASLAGAGVGGNLVPPEVSSAITTANQANNLYTSAKTGNLAGVLGAGVGLTGAQNTQIGDTGITYGDAARYANIANAVANLDNNPAAFSRALSMILGSNKPGGTKVSEAGGAGPAGVNLAATDAGIMSDAGGPGFLAEVTGSAITAEDPRAAKLSPPPGYTVASTQDPGMQERPRYDENGDLLPRSDGTYYDRTQNAWFKPTGAFDLSKVEDLSSLFGGDTLPKDFRVGTGPLGTNVGTGAASEYADFLAALGLGPQVDYESLMRALNGVPGGTGGGANLGDLGELVIPGKRIPTDIPDLGEIVIPGERIPPDTELPPDVEPPVVEPPVVEPPPPPPPKEPPPKEPPPKEPPPAPVTPPPTKVTPPKKTPTLPELSLATGIPLDVLSPEYAGEMGDFDLFAALEDFLGEQKDEQKGEKKGAQKTSKTTKMASGGYLDDLLGDQTSVDDLLKLLR